MARPDPRQLQVIRSASVTPNMFRVTLGGAGMASFPDDQAGGYVKLMVPDAAAGRPLARTYTVRYQREDEIDIDFALHEDSGPATRWALAAQAGDMIGVGGPGPKKMVDHQADWVLLAGDMTALPAISVNIESLPAHATGHAAIEITDEADIQPLSAPEGLDIQWLVNPQPGAKSHLLIDHVKCLPWREGRASAWAACEFNSMRQLRDYLRTDRQLGTDALYISSYWKYGSNEDSHRVAKRADAQAA